jgi:hypothetical protein
MTSRIVSMLAAVLLLAGPARAQRVVAEAGRFTLPFAVSWGATTLPPGEYTVRVLPRASTPTVLAIEGEGRQTIVLASQSAPCEATDGVLTLRREGESRTVVSLRLAGVSTTFLLTKPAPPQGGEQLAQAVESVPVGASR